MWQYKEMSFLYVIGNVLRFRVVSVILDANFQIQEGQMFRKHHHMVIFGKINEVGLGH